MGFFLQLRILLWKNFTLKRRSAFVVIEIFKPLVLFVILLAIRYKQPASPERASHYKVSPLPSAGVVSIMQSFCDKYYAKEDQHQFPTFPHSQVYELLNNFQAVAEHNNFFEPGFSLEDMNRLPSLYKNIIEEPTALHDTLTAAHGVRLKTFLIDKTSLMQALVQNFSIPADVVDTIFDAHINFTEVYNIFEKAGLLQLLQQQQSLLDSRPRVRRSLGDEVSDGVGRLGEGLGEGLGKGLGEGLGQKLLHPLPAGPLGPLGKWPLGGGGRKSLVRQLILAHPEYLTDKQFLHVMSTLLGFSTQPLDPQDTADVFKKVLLAPSSLHYMICESKELEKILILPAHNNTPSMMASEKHMCNMSSADWTCFSQLLNEQINSTQIINQLNLASMNMTGAANRVKDFVTNLQQFMLFEKNMATLATLAAKLPQDACGVDNGSTPAGATAAPPPTTTDSYSNTTGTTTTTATNNSTSQKKKKVSNLYKDNKYSGLVKVWVAMQTTICGRPAISMEKLNTMTTDDLSLTSQQKLDLGILVHLLYSNPKVLYTPMGGDIDRVINKANGIFSMLDRMSTYATNWLNVSREIRDYLNENSTSTNLDKIREIQSSMKQMQGLRAVVHNATLQRFVTNTTIPPVAFFRGQLDVIDNAACSWLSLLHGIRLDVFRGFPSEDDLVHYFLHDAYKDGVTVLASVVFTNVGPNGSLPKHVTYKIRQNASFVQNTKQVHEKYWRPGPRNWAYNYYQFGFIWIQDMIERAIIEVQTNRSVTEPGSYVHQMPYPCFMSDQFLFMIEHVMPLVLTISWVYTVAMLVQSIVHEKELRLKEVMKMMGLSNSVHWCAWFITTFVQMGITMVMLTLMLKYGHILTHSDPILIFCVLQLYVIATIAFSFLLSVCYSKAKLAAACAGIIYFLSYVPYMYVAIREEAAGDRISAWAKSLASLFSTTAFGLGSKYIAYYEIEGVGIHWNNIHQSPVDGDEFSLLIVILMMLFDTMLYLMLTWYIENVHPGSYGLPRPWYFPFTKAYWYGHAMTQSSQCSWRNVIHCVRGYSALSVTEEDQACALEETSSENSEAFEPEPTHLPLGVCIDNLTKIYKTGKLAVNKLKMNLFEGQITSFLGHNGAGKTTTMSILTGLFPPTSGNATIYGSDIRSEMEEIRKNLGMCPQHNVLFDKLTVDEHLWFYGRLKGVSAADIQKEMDTMIVDIGLPKKRHHTVDCLSGGMKRKLSVAVAFVGNSRCVILDEPTAGVDPFARRDIWDLLIKYKAGRTILLSTHHMDEADILSDRIAILASGQLKCCGSSLFLKGLYGEGYHLTVVKASPEEEEYGDGQGGSDGVSLGGAASASASASASTGARVLAAIRAHVPSAYRKSETGAELHYMLPFSEARKGRFEGLFRALDADRVALGVASYGVVDTSLEEVFLKVTELADQQAAQRDNEKNAAVETTQEAQQPPVPPAPPAPAPASTLAPPHRPTHVRQSSDSVELGCLVGGDSGVVHCHRRSRSSVSVMSHESVKSVDSVRSLGDTSLCDFLYSGGNQRVYTRLAAEDAQDALGDEDAAVSGPECGRRLTAHALYAQQFYAVMVKRFTYTRRNWKGLFSQILLPALFISIAMTVALTAPQLKDLPPIVLSPAQYYNVTQPRGNFIPYSVWRDDDNDANADGDGDAEPKPAPDTYNASDADDIVRTFYLPSGIAATCVLASSAATGPPAGALRHWDRFTRSYLDTYYEPSCHDVFTAPRRHLPPASPPNIAGVKKGSEYQPLYFPSCSCKADNSGDQCALTGFRSPPTRQTVTADLMEDISGDHDEEYYLKTTDLYRLRRYGGFTLGLIRHIVPKTFGHNLPPLIRKLAVRKISKVWYNHKGLHSMPVYLNTLNNAILRANIPESMGNPAAYGITLISHPMNNTNNRLSMDYILAGSDVLIAIFIICAMSFVPASFVLFLVYERSIKAKHLQMVSGINRVVYWLANYVWDLCNYLIPGACCILILRGFDIPAYVSTANFPAVILLFLLYGWSITPMMYPASFIFKEPSTAYICLIVLNLFIGITCIITSFMLEMFQLNNKSKDLERIHDVLKCIFLLFPNYCLGRGLMDVAFNEYKNEYYFKTGQYDHMTSPFEWHLTMRKLVVMGCMGFIFFIFTVLCEFRFFIKPRTVPVSSMLVPPSEDKDVSNERRRVMRGSGRRDVVRLENLTKIYVTRKLGRHLATDRVCLGVPQGECFGLLGVNGAGKTTTFKMLTGDLKPTAGDAFINGHSILTDMRQVQQAIGYCPQFDALYDELTGREHLQLYARLRGILPKQQTQVVDWALKKLALMSYADVPSGTYSGGNKRKLSTAIALIGQPPVIFLDEPTTGMDPHSRRFLWDLILSLIRSGKSVILTSHSMEECEVLCTRMAIMVNGHFQCLGSTQHLKSRFGDGYTVSIRVRGPDYGHQMESVMRFITRHFPKANQKKSHHNTLQFELATGTFCLADLFSKMEQAQSQLSIDDYSVNQNTLDNVFINFAELQQEIVREAAADGRLTDTADQLDDDVPLLIDHTSTRLEFLNTNTDVSLL